MIADRAEGSAGSRSRDTNRDVADGQTPIRLNERFGTAIVREWLDDKVIKRIGPSLLNDDVGRQ
jgi:hypothetical protein